VDKRGTFIPVCLPTIRKHELTRLASAGHLSSLLQDISNNQALVKSDISPGGGGSRNAFGRMGADSTGSRGKV
jgi:hypothetical protein